MKKRLLITSIVMMLVVAVALSTATYAWFTSNTSVTASSITMTASTNSGSALGIGWIGSQSYLGASNLITANAPQGVNGTYDPMVPAELYTAAQATASNEDDITAATPSTVQFKGGTIKSVGGNFVFNSDVAGKTPYTFNGTVSDATYNAFYVRNLSTANDVPNLKLTLEWGADTYTKATAYAANTTYYTSSGENTYVEAATQPTSETFGQATYYTKDKRDDNLVRVGVFAKAAKASVSNNVAATPDNTTYNFIAVLGKSANLNTEWGVVAANGNVASLCADNAEVKTVTEINFGQLDALYQVDLVVLVWLDGVALNDDTAGACSTIGLKFEAAAPTQG